MVGRETDVRDAQRRHVAAAPRPTARPSASRRPPPAAGGSGGRSRGGPARRGAGRRRRRRAPPAPRWAWASSARVISASAASRSSATERSPGAGERRGRVRLAPGWRQRAGRGGVGDRTGACSRTRARSVAGGAAAVCRSSQSASRFTRRSLRRGRPASPRPARGGRAGRGQLGRIARAGRGEVRPAAALPAAQRRDAVDQVAGLAPGAHQIVGQGHVNRRRARRC